MAQFFKHAMALVETENVGDGTRIWAFAHVLPGAVIGRDCNICDHVFIENQVRVGDRVTIKCGVQLWDGITIEDDVFIGPNVTFTNDPFPRSKQHLKEYPQTIIRRGASIGANATLLPGIVIGEKAMIGAGSVVTRDVPVNAIVRGNPARIVGYVDSEKIAGPAEPAAVSSMAALPQFRHVRRVKAYDMPIITDIRGSITVGEIDRNLPFRPARYFTVFNVPGEQVRGAHAHRECEQFLVCLSGRVTVMVDDGTHREELVLDSPTVGIYLPKLTWTVQYKYSADCVLLVLASHPYNAADYIRNYDEFLQAIRHA